MIAFHKYAALAEDREKLATAPISYVLTTNGSGSVFAVRAFVPEEHRKFLKKRNRYVGRADSYSSFTVNDSDSRGMGVEVGNILCVANPFRGTPPFSIKTDIWIVNYIEIFEEMKARGIATELWNRANRYVIDHNGMLCHNQISPNAREWIKRKLPAGQYELTPSLHNEPYPDDPKSNIVRPISYNIERIS